VTIDLSVSETGLKQHSMCASQIHVNGSRSDKMQRTLDEIREEGLKALRERLGRADMIRFLQQFETGSGDYAKQRQAWVDSVALEDIEELANGNTGPDTK